VRADDVPESLLPGLSRPGEAGPGGVTLLDEVSLRLGFEISDVEASECRTLSYLSSTMFACLPPW
jgi:hypothetical protein